jgi:hypothetical protein
MIRELALFAGLPDNLFSQPPLLAPVEPVPESRPRTPGRGMAANLVCRVPVDA